MTQRRALRMGAIAALAVAAITLSGCAATDSSGPTVITLSSWYDDDIIGPALDAANAHLADENIVLEHTFVPIDDYNTWLSTQLASGEGPDIIVDGGGFNARVRAGNLVDLTGDEVLDGFNSSGLALATSADEKVYGFPSYGWFAGIFTNNAVFDAAGVEIPGTFDEMLDASAKLSAAGYQPIAAGLADSDRGFHSLMGYLMNAYYNNGEGSPDVDFAFANGETTLSENLQDSVDEWYKLVEQGTLNPQMVGISDAQAQASFINGEAAMYYSGPWDYQKWTDAGLDFSFIAPPGNDASNPWLLGGPAANFGINIDSTHQTEAKKALDALASVEAQQAFLDSNPGSFSYREGVSAELPAEYAPVADALAAGNVGVPWDRWGVNMPSQTLVDTTIKLLQSVVGGQLSTTDFLKQLDEEADSIRY